jgi:ribonucleoside-diphosphate reductase subunit M1
MSNILIDPLTDINNNKMDSNQMYVIKRNGEKQELLFDNITRRNQKLAKDLNIDTTSLSLSVIQGLKSGMTTREIDFLSCENAIYKSTYEPNYATLASRIAINDLHKTTPKTFRECIDKLSNNINKLNNELNPLIETTIYKFALEHIEIVEKSIKHENDYNYTYFGFKTLEKSYLQKVNEIIVERPQYMLMRVALGIHGPSNRNNIIHNGDIELVLQTYNELSNMKFTHATPTLFYSGTPRPQMSSCFLLNCPDSINGITDCWKTCSFISKYAGGIGVDLTVRSKGAYISGTNGNSNGIIPLIKVFNEIARYVDQGGGKRKGAISLYLQPWHPDILEFLEIRFNTGPEEARARDIFPALWIPDLFFKRLQQANSKWSLFCPGKYPELVTLYGEEFEKRYIELENQKEFTKQIPTEELWKRVMKSLEETGLPYMMSKDNVNNKSNHKNIGPITGSNLCTEIVQYHDSKSTAVCNLASICLPQFVKKDNTFDFEELGRITEIIVHNMNNIIDKNYYPEYEIDCFDEDEDGYDNNKKLKKVIGRNNNLKYRPIGIGVQGLADVFAKMKLSWDSQEARILNQVIFETIYYHSLNKSYELSRNSWGPYSHFNGSPTSFGILQYDMWNVIPLTHSNKFTENSQYKIPLFDWENLKCKIKQYGVRNSLMIAPMPTASTSQIMGNTEAFEPLTSNLYIRKVGAGDFPIVNTYLYNDLKQLGLWRKEIVDEIIMNNGSIQNIDIIPEKIKKLYKTVWELSQKIIVDFAADRGAFIDQTQSLNIFMERPTVSKLSSLYMYGWKRGLKTLSYYLRTQPATGAVKFTVMNENVNKDEKKNENNGAKETVDIYKINKYTGQKFICTEEVCTSCSS